MVENCEQRNEKDNGEVSRSREESREKCKHRPAVTFHKKKRRWRRKKRTKRSVSGDGSME